MMGRIGGPPSHGAARVMHAALTEVPSGSYLENDRVVASSLEIAERRNRALLAGIYRDRLSRFASGRADPVD